MLPLGRRGRAADGDAEALPDPEAARKADNMRAPSLFFRSAHFRHWLLFCALASPLLLLLIGALVAILLVIHYL